MRKPNKLENDHFWKAFLLDGPDGGKICYYPHGSDEYGQIYSRLEKDIQLFSRGDTIELDSEKLENYETIFYEGWDQELGAIQYLVRKGREGSPRVFFISDDFLDPIVAMGVDVLLRNLSCLRERFPYYWVLCIDKGWILESRFAGRLTRGEFRSHFSEPSTSPCNPGALSSR